MARPSVELRELVVPDARRIARAHGASVEQLLAWSLARARQRGRRWSYLLGAVVAALLAVPVFAIQTREGVGAGTALLLTLGSAGLLAALLGWGLSRRMTGTASVESPEQQAFVAASLARWLRPEALDRLPGSAWDEILATDGAALEDMARSLIPRAPPIPPAVLSRVAKLRRVRKALGWLAVGTFVAIAAFGDPPRRLMGVLLLAVGGYFMTHGLEAAWTSRMRAGALFDTTFGRPARIAGMLGVAASALLIFLGVVALLLPS